MFYSGVHLPRSATLLLQDPGAFFVLTKFVDQKNQKMIETHQLMVFSEQFDFAGPVEELNPSWPEIGC